MFFFKYFSPTRMEPKLHQWLKDLDVDSTTIEKFAAEDLTYLDVLTLMTREDLTKLNLRLGPELRIWHRITIERNKNMQSHSALKMEK